MRLAIAVGTMGSPRSQLGARKGARSVKPEARIAFGADQRSPKASSSSPRNDCDVGFDIALRGVETRHCAPRAVPMRIGEDFLYDFKGGSLRSPPAAPQRAAGARKLASSPARAALLPQRAALSPQHSCSPTAAVRAARSRQEPAPGPPPRRRRQARSHARPVWLCRWGRAGHAFSPRSYGSMP